MTRAGSKLVLRTSPAPGHYLCIKWDFASLLQLPTLPQFTIILPCCIRHNYTYGGTQIRDAWSPGSSASSLRPSTSNLKTLSPSAASPSAISASVIVEFLQYAHKLNVRRPPSRTVGAPQWFVSQFGEVDASYQISFLGCKRIKILNRQLGPCLIIYTPQKRQSPSWCVGHPRAEPKAKIITNYGVCRWSV